MKVKLNADGKKVFERYPKNFSNTEFIVESEESYFYRVTSPLTEGIFSVLKTHAEVTNADPIPVKISPVVAQECPTSEDPSPSPQGENTVPTLEDLPAIVPENP